MKIFARIKKSLSFRPGKKKPVSSSYASVSYGKAATGASGQYKRRHHSLAKWKQRILTKKRPVPEEYGIPTTPKKWPWRMWGTVVLATLLLAMVAFGGGSILLNWLQELTFFKVNRIEVSGCVAVAKEKILEQSTIVINQTSLISMNASEIEAKLATIPWVARVKVQRNWPSTVEMVIEENAPVALLHSPELQGMQLQYVDSKGMPFSPVSSGGDVDFPIITGLAEVKEQGKKEKALAEAMIFLRKLKSNDPHLPSQSVSEIHINQSGDMIVYLVEYPFPIFFGNGNTKEKYSQLVQVLRALYKKQKGKELLSQIEYIELDYLNDKKVRVGQNGSG